MQEFDQISPTISTLIATFEGNIDYGSLFFLLDIGSYRINVSKRGRSSLEKVGEPGTIASIRMKHPITEVNHYRGFLPKKEPFNHSLTLEVYTSTKLINTKISKGKIQMCGNKSEADGREVVEIIREKMKLAVKRLKTLQHPDLPSIISYVLENSKGEEVMRPPLKMPKTKKYLEVPTPDHSINLHLPKAKSSVSSLVRKMITESSFTYYSDLSNFCKGLLELPSSIDITMGPATFKTAMVNYTFDIGPTDREALEEIFSYGKWHITDDPDKKVFTKLELPYEPYEDHTTKTKKNGSPCHKFLVYNSGSTTQSGPGGELAKQAYDEFTRRIRETVM